MSWPRAILALGLVLLPVGAVAQCRVDVRPVSFGDINLGRDSHGKGMVVIDCERPTKFEVAIVGGGERQLVGPGGRIRYRLFQDPSYRAPWGDGGKTGERIQASNDGRRPTKLTIYGAIPKQGGVAKGEYADQLQVVLSY